jgi:hypothetical protein
MSSHEEEKKSIAKESSKAMLMVVVYIVLYVAVSIVMQYLFLSLLPKYGIPIQDYAVLRKYSCCVSIWLSYCE